MALLDIVKKGSTDRSVTIRIIDAADGTPENSVEHDTSGIDLWYRREGAAKVSITEAALSALTDAHSDGGIELIGDGEYRLDLPDAAFATGANYVDVGGTVTDMIVIGGRVRLVDYDPEDAVRAGLTALPNAAADAAGGLVISDAGGFDIDNRAPAAAAVVNLNTVFNTDFATAYDASNDRWNVGVVAIGSNVLNAAAVAADAVAKIQNGLSTLTAAQVNAQVDTAISDAGLATAEELAKVPKKDEALTFTRDGADVNSVSITITDAD